MDCRDITEELSAYVDGELNDKLVRQIESHLAECSECAAELHTLKASARLVQSNVRELALRPEIWQNVHAAIASMPAPSRPESLLQFILGRRWLMIPATAAAALLLAIGTGTYLRHRESEKRLVQYMNDYMQVQHEEERARARIMAVHENAPVAEPRNGKAASNPFAVVNYSLDENPFRSEEQ